VTLFYSCRMAMTALEKRLHHAVIEAIIAGRPHDPRTLSDQLDEPRAEIEQALDRLAEAHALVLHPTSKDVWVAHPFSCSPTATWVAIGERGWWAPCMWCAFGIATLVDGDAVVHTRIGGEAEAVEITASSELLVHFALRPREAWGNVIHYCATVLPFRSEEEIDRWSKRHQLPRGVAVPVAIVVELAKRWYGSHRDPEWVKWSTGEAQQIFNEVGLTGPFWQLAASGERF
jgi:hypothetical protein